VVALDLARLPGFDQSCDIQENPVVFTSAKVDKEVKVVFKVFQINFSLFDGPVVSSEAISTLLWGHDWFREIL